MNATLKTATILKMLKLDGTMEDFDVTQAVRDMHTALTESVRLQSHYAELLNAHDSGQRLTFATPEHWIQRLKDKGLLK